MASKKTVVLWIVQIILALVFLFSGGSKLVMTAAALMAQTPLPILMIRLIGVLEILGGLGLVLPGMLKMNRILVPMAASGLLLIMTGAVVISLMLGFGAMALTPLVIGLLCAFVAYNRWN